MAAPQQHALTNTSCTFATSPAAFSNAGSYGSGQPSFCGDLHGRVSVTNDHDVPSVVCSSAAVVPHPILAHSASRKTKPCSLCGTAALRSQSSLVPNSPISPQEQPVVLLHRLEDGLPEGDVDSLRAFGTIRLLPVHRHCGKVEPITDDSKHECDKKYQSVTSHIMAPGNLAYKSFKRGNIKKRTELPAGSRSYGDLNISLTNEILRTYSASDDHHTLREKLSENTVKNATDIVTSEVDSGGTSHRASKRTEVNVCDNSIGSRLDPGEEALGARRRAVSSRHNYPPPYSTTSLSFTVSSAPQSSHRVPSPQHQTLSSSQAETLDRSPTIRSPLSSLNNLSLPQTSTSSTTNSHSHGSTSQSCSTQDTIHQRSSPDTPLPVVCSPVVPLTTTTLSCSPLQNIGSPSAISPPESPSSPASPFSPRYMCSPSACDHENLHSSCSTEIQPSSSPYSPCTLPSLPASPTSLPSSSESPPSPAPSIDSPPVSPTTSSSQQSEASHNQAPRPCSDRLGGDLLEDVTNSVTHLDTALESKAEPERSKIRDSRAVPQHHVSRVSLMENTEELPNKSFSGQEVAQAPSASQTVRAPSAQIHVPEDVSTASQNSETEIQEDLCPENSVGHECEDREKSVAEVGPLKPDLAKCFLNSESESVEVEKNSSDPRNSLMKLVLKVKHPGKQQLPLGPEKKEYNKENGIPKIVLTLRGKGPNKEYSCSNRLRNESESCSGENVNNKKHKSKRNKRQKPKDREKTRKVMKGDKHKRHLELFGEDSNDSCDIIPDKFNNHPVGRRHPKTPSIDEQELRPSLALSTLEESPPVHSERDLPPTHTLSPSESPSDCAKDGESGETIDSPPSPVGESPSPSLPSLTSDAFEINTVIIGRTKDRPSMEENEVYEGQTKSDESSTQEAFKITVEVPETRDDEASCSELKQEETSQTSSGMLHCSDINHQVKHNEGLILRSRRSRHAKNTESGRNSDACLWVSFGVNAPVPLPATDLPSLEPLFTCREKMRLKESETNESKGHTSPSQLPVGVGEKSVPKATHKGWKEREKTEARPSVIKEDTEQVVEEKAKLLTEYSDCKTDPSYSHYKGQSSSSHKDNNCTPSRIRSQSDPTHHRSRQSHKRPRKSENCREEVDKKEVDSCHPNPLDASERDDGRNQEVSTDIYKEKSATSELAPVCDTEDVRMESEEKSATKEPSSFPNVSLPVSDNTDGHKDQSNSTSQPGENIAPNEVGDKPERPGIFKSEESPDNLYYRPKKIRRACNGKMTTDHCNEKKSLDQAEDWKAQVSRTMEKISDSYKDGDSVKFSSPEAVTTTPSGICVAESELSMVEGGTSEVKTDPHWKPQEELVRRDMQPKSPQDSETSSEQRKRKYQSPTPQGQERITSGQVSMDEQSKHTAEGVKEQATEKQEGIGKDCLPGNEDNEKQEISKKEKEKRKKSRREKRKDNSGSGSRCSVLQEAQLRREVEHEEERGRRLAQEIKGFNWLEQKIKNSSLLSSRSAPSTPTNSPSAKESESTSRTLSTPTATPSTQFTFSNKEEEHARKNSVSGSSGGIGLKRHLQTAVPPLVPSSKVTALPKRRQSLGPPTTPPCSASSAICNVTSVPSMTVQGALYTCEPTHYRSEHGRVGPPLEKTSTSFGHEHAECDKATLYSSTSSTKATLYGVKDNNFEAFYDTVSANAVNYYGSASSGNIDTQYNIATSPAICFYGSAKYQELGLHPDKTSSTGSHANSSIISTSRDSSATTDHQIDTLHSPKPDTYSSRNSDWSTKQVSSPNSNSQNSAYSADSHSPQQFSHKQALLRRAFQEMLESEPNSSSTEQAKEKQVVMDSSPANTEMNKADGSKCKEIETACLTSSQSSSESTSPADITNLKSVCSDSAPALLSSKSSSETTDSCIFSYSPKSVTASMKLEKDLSDPICTESKILSFSTGMSEDAKSITCKLDSNNKTVKPESDINSKENYSDLETPVQNVNDSRNLKVTENSKDLQSNVIDCIVSASTDIDMKALKDEICCKDDGKNVEDAEVQPSLLLSVLYKELMKTRQEVEKLRKVQELMLTEKGEKKADAVEQSSENTVDEDSHNNESILENKKDYEVINDTELKIDYGECHYHENKRSKISIRSDLLPTADSIALDTTSSDASALQKSISQADQNSLPVLTNPSVAQTNSEISVITVEGATVPDTSRPSRISPAIPAASPGLSSNISVSPNITSSLPRGHARASPGISSPGVSRTSPGVPKPSPITTRASPGTPKSTSGVSISSPGTSVSPAMPSSPRIPRNSPGATRSSPGVLRMSPGLPLIHSGIPRASPGSPIVSPGSSRNGTGLMRNGSEAPIINPGIPQMSPTSNQVSVFNLPTNPSTEYLQMSHSHSAMTTVQPKMTTVQSITSPVLPIPRFPQTPITSTAVPIISPTGGKTNCPVSRISPSISKIDTAATVSLNKTDTSLTDMSPTKLRSVFGISNSEVELMPVSVGAKQPLYEPQPQTFLKLVEDQHHQTSETPLLLNAVQGVRQDSGSKDVESSTSHGPVPFHNLGCHEDPKRISKTHQYVGEMKRHTFSTSDLPDHVPSACKQPPPLKPVAAMLRRHSDNMDIHSVMHHQAMYPGSRKNLASSLHSSASAAEHKNANSVHAFNQSQYSPTQYPMPSTGRRRNSDNNSSERNQGYQQPVPMGMQHQYPHLTPGSSVMRSLGPDKATIFPIPPTIPTGIRPFRPTTPPSVTRAQLEQFQNENFYRSNFSFFEKIREKFAHSCDSGVSAMDRLQSSTANVEKPLQPQTFVPRVLVRESIPEASSHIPTATFTSLHFPNPNQPPPNAMPSHQNHFPSNMHSGSSIHHMAQARLHTSTNQATSSIQRNSSSGRSGEKLCFHCPQQARFICSGCKKAWYCSEQCQREHWSIHSAACVL